MAFVNLSLLFGSLLLAIPIVLHLVMRQQPKQLVFPAVRFILHRRDTNRRQLQLRHWLLLFLRCLLIVVLAAALARPSVHSRVLGNWILIGVLSGILVVVALLAALAAIQQRSRYAVYGFLSGAGILAVAIAILLWTTLARSSATEIGDGQAPVAAVLVFDTSSTMQYRHQNQSRLEKAQGIASWLIRQLPPDSEVAVVDSRVSNAVFAVDLAAAERSIERLETTAVPQPFLSVLEEALELAKACTKPRREVYVFTDLTQHAWSDESAVSLQRKLAETDDVLLYIVDVGVASPHNVRLGDVQLAAETITRSENLQLQSQILVTGDGHPVAVELYLEDLDPSLPVIRDGQIQLPESRLRGKRIVDLSAGNQSVSFSLGGLEPGTHQGQLRIASDDGLPLDNVRYFAVQVLDALPVLVLSPAGTVTNYLVDAISPLEYRETGRAEYDCILRDQADLPNLDLRDYAAVCLLDPAPLMPPDWGRLADYVQQGGGLALFLGHNAEPASFNVPEAMSVLGAQLTQQWRSPGDVFLAPRNLNHPVTTPFRGLSGSVPWSAFPVYRHWGLDDFAPYARPIILYSNNQPALIETSRGRGRCLVMTTPISDPPNLRGRQPWNELPTAGDAWPYFVLVNEMLRYLVDTSGLKLNYLAGETAILPNARERYPKRYELFTPLGQPQDATADAGRITVQFTDYPGAYRLKGFLAGPVLRGFCVNLPSAATELTRIDRDELDLVLGKDRYHYAQNIDQIVLGVGQARLGREFYPFLLPLLALLLACEYLLANRFYAARPDSDTGHGRD